MPTLDFKGKQFVYSHHLSVPFRELKVVADKSLPQQGKAASLDDNLIIHGDNLEALKALLPTHAGKVDCIFIDPPYNTGNEGWCYNDNVRSPLMQEWLKKSANPVDKEDLERHDKWLCMMWPRIQLLWELLSENGSLFVICDDNEATSLGSMLKEICGEDKFVSSIVWQKVFAKKNKAIVSGSHDTIYLFTKNGMNWERNLLARSEEDIEKDFTNPDNDPRGPWQSVSFSVQSEDSERRSAYRYKVKLANGEEVGPPKGRHWNGLIERFKELDRDNRIWFGTKGNSRPRVKVFLSEVQDGIVPDTWWKHEVFGNNQEAKKELNEIFGEGDVFPTPKPLKLLDGIVSIATKKDSIVLDSFAGSGTTAHAVLNSNYKDGGNRKFILVECETYADEVTAERIRRVIKGYPFKGKQKKELLSEKITWSVFEKKHAELLEKIAKVETKHSSEFDKIKKELKDGVLTVTGERKVDEFAPGIGGSFTYCTLGEPIQIESLLTGEAMPSFDALARYVFYTATGQSLENVAKASADGFIGETDLFRIHLFYRPDSEWLRSNEAALNADKVAAIVKNNATKKRTIVFAVAKFMSQKDLTEKRIEFCQLPYAIHRIMGA